MKKIYVKPMLFFECFQVDQCVAACDVRMENAVDVSGSCYGVPMDPNDYPWGPMQLFRAGSAVCSTVTEEYCYTNGTSVGFYPSIVFNS